MKKSILIILFSFFIAITVNAQISKGSVFLGGSFTYGHTTTDTKPMLYIRPEVGIVNKENNTMGIILNYTSTSPYYNYNYKSYGGGLFYRVNKSIGKNFYVFGQGELLDIYSKQVTSPNNSDIQTIKQYNYSLAFFPGISYGITRKFYVDASLTNLVLLSYNKQNSEYSSNNIVSNISQNTFLFTTYTYTNIPLSIGFHFLL